MTCELVILLVVISIFRIAHLLCWLQLQIVLRPSDYLFIADFPTEYHSFFTQIIIIEVSNFEMVMSYIYSRYEVRALVKAVLVMLSSIGNGIYNCQRHNAVSKL